MKAAINWQNKVNLTDEQKNELLGMVQAALKEQDGESD